MKTKDTEHLPIYGARLSRDENGHHYLDFRLGGHPCTLSDESLKRTLVERGIVNVENEQFEAKLPNGIGWMPGFVASDARLVALAQYFIDVVDRKHPRVYDRDLDLDAILPA